MSTPMKADVISLTAAREIKRAGHDDPHYRRRVERMDKLELLNEMVTFQEERSRARRLTPTMMVRGKILFTALEGVAETDALRVLVRSYRKHLDLEFNDYLRTGRLQPAD